MDDIVNEAQALADRGVKELILIEQDTGEYGIDLYGQRSLSLLLRKLNDIPSVYWIRLLYVYPETIDDALIETMKNCDKVVPYIDIPLQHINDRVLKAMGRHTNESSIRALIKTLRDEIPQIVIRSTSLRISRKPKRASQLYPFCGSSTLKVRVVSIFAEEVRLRQSWVNRFPKKNKTQIR
jgi:ribosomal protein S12 methylthiotransferase